MLLGLEVIGWIILCLALCFAADKKRPGERRNQTCARGSERTCRHLKYQKLAFLEGKRAFLLAIYSICFRQLLLAY